MSSKDMQQRLAAILSADVSGYSRLLSDDETATVRTLIAYREQVKALLTDHNGRLVDFTGDNFLAEFPTALGAVRSAIEIQRVLAARNAHLSPDRKMDFRMGIHLGDILIEGDRIYGEGVNIAARLQSMAEPGGICISATVHEQVRNKVGVEYEDLGDRLVKNIPDQVHVYRIQIDRSALGWDWLQRIHRKQLIAVSIAAAVAATAIVTWPRPLEIFSQLSGVAVEPAQLKAAAFIRPDAADVSAPPPKAKNFQPRPEDEVSGSDTWLAEETWLAAAQDRYVRKRLDCEIKNEPDKSPRNVIEEVADQVILILGSDIALVEKRERLEAIVCGWFDFTSMSKRVLGPHWRSLTASEQGEFTYEFTRYLTLNYGRRVSEYDGERATIDGERKEPNGDVTVRTRMVGGNYDGALVDYRFRKTEGTWLISDVILEGISLAMSYRDQFQQVMGHGEGARGLIASLRSYNISKTAMEADDG